MDSSKNEVYLEFNPNEHDIVDLSCFVSEVLEPSKRERRIKRAIDSLSLQLSTKGWSIVRLPPNLYNENASNLNKNLMEFFSLPESEKSKASEKNGFGYSKTNHKEGVRILSGSGKTAPKLPEPLSGELDALRDVCDNLTQVLVDILSTKLFSLDSATSLIEKSKLPSTPVCMLDIAHYFNKTTIDPPEHGLDVEEVNCVPHIDPGLLSISFLSSAEGLQMQDPTNNTWIAGPNNGIESQRDLGVLWLGEAARTASGGKFVPGVHRVIYPKTQGDRITMWFEICTETQRKGPADIEFEADTEITLHAIQGPNKKAKAKKGEKLSKILRSVEFDRGVPMSKTLYDEPDFSRLSPNPLYPDDNDQGKQKTPRDASQDQDGSRCKIL